MSDETKKTQSELSDEQLEDSSGGSDHYLDTYESFRTLAPAAQTSETSEPSLKDDGERQETDVEYTITVTDTETS